MITVVPIQFLPGNKWAQIRELCGKDEQSVNGTRSIDAIYLLDRILQASPANEKVIDHSAVLPVPDRDRVLTALYFNTYGSKIETTVTCSSCNSRFDLNFSLDDWVNDLSICSGGKLNDEGPAYPFKAPGGLEYRLPTGEDEMSVIGLEPSVAEKELLKRCLPEATTYYDPDLLQHTMEEMAPLAKADFEAQCPECSGMQRFHFNLQQYLLSSLLKERDNLVTEVHLLAKFYGWGLNEILDLPRNLRRSFVTLAGTSL